MPPWNVMVAGPLLLSATPCDVPVAVTKPPSVTLPPVKVKICTAQARREALIVRRTWPSASRRNVEPVPTAGHERAAAEVQGPAAVVSEMPFAAGPELTLVNTAPAAPGIG